MKFSTALFSISSLFILNASAVQKTEIRNCGVTGTPETSPVTGIYNIFDDGEDICVTRDVEVDWNKDATFEVTMYGTHCFFHTEKAWPDAQHGEKFGYVNCPGMKNIEAIKDETDYSGVCWWGIFPVVTGCRNRARMEWDGCLSCGKALCGASSECGTGCCDKNSDICSTPENSTCK